MIIQERIGCAGRCRIFVHDARTGLLLQTQLVRNKVVDDGTTFILERLIGNEGNIASYFAVGTDATPAAATQTTLLTEVYRTPVATSRLLDQYTVEIKGFLFSEAANGHTLKEFGIFGTGDTNGTPMLCRLTYNDIVKTTAVAVTYLYELTLTPE